MTTAPNISLTVELKSSFWTQTSLTSAHMSNSNKDALDEVNVCKNLGEKN